MKKKKRRHAGKHAWVCGGGLDARSVHGPLAGNGTGFYISLRGWGAALLQGEVRGRRSTIDFVAGAELSMSGTASWEAQHFCNAIYKFRGRHDSTFAR